MDSENLKIIGVTKGVVTIEIIDPTEFNGQFNIGSYVKIPYEQSDKKFVVGIIKNYKIKNLDSNIADTQSTPPSFMIDVELIGSYIEENNSYKFERGAHGIPLPPNNGIEILSNSDYKNIYSCKLKPSDEFKFSNLLLNEEVEIPIDGNKFFNKHFAIVGSTGSGKSHTVASILQRAIESKDGSYAELNNSHIILFDIHGEYSHAFPEANLLSSTNIRIPYWLFDGDELKDLFIESNEQNSHNQISQFQFAVTENKKIHNMDIASQNSKIYFDSPLKFDIDEVIQYIKNMNKEVIGRLKDEGLPKKIDGTLIHNRVENYFKNDISFCASSTATDKKAQNGPFNGDFDRFILRLETIRNNSRLGFLFDNSDSLDIVEILKQFIGYGTKKSNITIIDLSGIPFEVLSITVSLISRILFEFGYFYRKTLEAEKACETPLLLVYEEAHKYVPKYDAAKYKASRNAIERIAKEGRKYGVTLGIVSQRPSEISETIFSQCNNFIAMRLTNPEDQNYVKRLLPDSLGDMTDNLSSLQAGEALLIGESIIIPSLVKIYQPIAEPLSSDINYFNIWKKQWHDEITFSKVTNEWLK